MASEHLTQQQILLSCGRGDTRLWRNNVGKVLDKNGRLVSFGLCVGSSDIIGYRTITITPDMVGERIAVFSAVEVKSLTGRPTKEQIAFISNVQSAGGNAGIARSVSDAEKILRIKES